MDIDIKAKISQNSEVGWDAEDETLNTEESKKTPYRSRERLTRSRRKRFRRLREEGHPVEVARLLSVFTNKEREEAKTKHLFAWRPKMDDADQSTTSPMEMIDTEYPSSPEQHPNDIGRDTNLTIAIIPANFPLEAFTIEQQSELEGRLACLILICKDKPGPQFKDTTFKVGLVVINCYTKYTVDWVKAHTDKLQLTNMETIVVDECDIPNSIVAGNFPGSSSYTRDEILQFISIQNDLPVHKWRIIRISNSNTAVNCVEAVFAIENSSYEALKAKSFRISYRLGRIQLVLKNRVTEEDFAAFVDVVCATTRENTNSFKKSPILSKVAETSCDEDKQQCSSLAESHNQNQNQDPHLSHATSKTKTCIVKPIDSQAQDSHMANLSSIMTPVDSQADDSHMASLSSIMAPVDSQAEDSHMANLSSIMTPVDSQAEDSHMASLSSIMRPIDSQAEDTHMANLSRNEEDRGRNECHPSTKTQRDSNLHVRFRSRSPRLDELSTQNDDSRDERHSHRIDLSNQWEDEDINRRRHSRSPRLDLSYRRDGNRHERRRSRSPRNDFSGRREDRNRYERRHSRSPRNDLSGRREDRSRNDRVRSRSPRTDASNRREDRGRNDRRRSRSPRANLSNARYRNERHRSRSPRADLSTRRDDRGRHERRRSRTPRTDRSGRRDDRSRYDRRRSRSPRIDISSRRETDTWREDQRSYFPIDERNDYIGRQERYFSPSYDETGLRPDYFREGRSRSFSPSVETAVRTDYNEMEDRSPPFSPSVETHLRSDSDYIDHEESRRSFSPSIETPLRIH